jgi:hypothetical protein
MSKNKTKRSIDLIEDITVEELRKDGLVEEVAVSDGTPSKKDETDAATDAVKANAETKASIDGSASKEADADEHVGSGPGATVPPSAENDKAVAATKAAANAAPTAEPPKTKAGLINAVYQQLATMKTEELSNVYATLVNPALPPTAEEPSPLQTGDDSTDKDMRKEEDEEKPELPADTTKPEKADDEDAGEDEDEIEGEDDDKAEDETTKESLEVLMKAEKSLSEGFRSKATELFESAVNAKVAAEISKIEESFAARLDEEVATATKDLAEKVDSYLDYVVKTWMEENKVAIEAGLRTEIAENFINSLKSVFVESYIEVPEGKENLVDTLNKEVSKLEEQLLKATESNMKLNESVNVLLRKQIIAEASSDLASTEAVKLDSLVEDVDFESADTFSKKVQTIKESYFRKPVSTPKKDTAVESAIHDDSQPEVEMTPLIAAVSSAISRTLKS